MPFFYLPLFYNILALVAIPCRGKLVIYQDKQELSMNAHVKGVSSFCLFRLSVYQYLHDRVSEWLAPDLFKTCMKNKIAKTPLEIELLCEKIILQQKVQTLQLHLWALQEVLKEKFKRKRVH